MNQPPSHLLKEFLSHPEPTEELFTSIARKTLLPIEEVKMWLNHLKTVEINRRRGAAKAAETRRRKRQQQQAQEQVRQIQQRHEYSCGICGGLYQDETTEIEVWIGCDFCDSWFHSTCLRMDSDAEDYVCDACKK